MLIILIATLQLVTLLVVTGVSFQWLRDSSKETTFNQIKECNSIFVEQAVGRIRSMALKDLDYGTPDQQKLQSYIEKSELPNQGVVVVVCDRTGKLLAHPELRHDSTLQNVTWLEYSKAKYCDGQKYEETVLQPLLKDLNKKKGFGLVKYHDHSRYMDVRRIPEIGDVVIVSQNSDDTQDTIAPLKSAKRLTFFSI